MSNRAKEIAAIMATYEPGQVWQFKTKGTEKWNDFVMRQAEPCWDWNSYDYRRKPEPKLRPWRTEEVPVGALHNWFGFVSVILAAHDNKMFFLNRNGEVTYNYLDSGAVNIGKFSLDNGKTWHPCGALEQA